MIPMTPTPPTMRPTEERASMTMKNTPVSWLKRSTSWSERRMAKLFSSVGPRPRRVLRRLMTWSLTSATGTPVSGNHEDAQEHVVGLQALQGGGVGNDGEVPHGVGEDVLLDLKHPHHGEELAHPESTAADPDSFSDGIELAEQLLGQGLGDDDDGPGLVHLG